MELRDITMLGIYVTCYISAIVQKSLRLKLSTLPLVVGRLRWLSCMVRPWALVPLVDSGGGSDWI